MKFSVTVKPKSRYEGIEKTPDGYLARVKEQPVENRANSALIRLISEHFGVPKSRIEILTGKRSKHKIVEIKNLSCL
jgi:uncharacterized protein YggU (UPF0235/DUF167 family)